jgi:cytochrome P450
MAELPAPLPKAFRASLRQQWQLVYRPRALTDSLRARYGGLVNLQTHAGPLILVLSAEGARQVLGADPAGYDAFWHESFSGIAGKRSLWVLSGEPHRRERQLLSPPFHSRSFRAYGETIRAITRQHLDRWQPGQTLSALDATLSISLDVILRLVFGMDEGVLMDQGRRVLGVLLGTTHPLIVFFPRLQRPWLPHWRRHARAKSDFAAWVDQLLALRRARGVMVDDVLGRMLTTSYSDGSRMADEASRDELLTILLAGHETTATALAWALYELGRHPQPLARLRAELAPLGPELDPEATVRLPYLSAVCNETLRLHTLLAEIGRVTTAPLECLGHAIPAGQSVCVSIMAIHHDPALYPEPDRFRPERFLERTFSPSEFLPFGGGHRRCLGAALSDYEMRIALAEIVTGWDFEPAVPEVEIRHDIAMGSRHGVPLRVVARRTPGLAPASAAPGDALHA